MGHTAFERNTTNSCLATPALVRMCSIPWIVRVVARNRLPPPPPRSGVTARNGVRPTPIGGMAECIEPCETTLAYACTRTPARHGAISKWRQTADALYIYGFSLSRDYEEH